MRNGTYRKQEIRPSAVLTTSYVAATLIELDQDDQEVVLYVDFTIGSLTTAELKVEFSDERAGTYFQETVENISESAITLATPPRQLNATGRYRIAIPTKDRFVQVSVKGTGTTTNSLAAITAIIGNL